MNNCFFSERYYSKPNLFEDKIPYGKALLSDNSEYAVVLQNGILATELRASKLMPRYIREWFGKKYNPELAKVDEKLCQIMELIKISHSSEYDALKAEVRKYGKLGFNCLRENISNLHLLLREKNRKSLLERAVSCILTMIRRLFRLSIPTIAYYRFGDVTTFEYDELLRKLRKDAFHLTEEELNEARKIFEYINTTGLNDECRLTASLIYKMQKGWSIGRKFVKIYDNIFSLTFDAKGGFFSMRHEGINYPLPENFYLSKDYFMRRESVATISIEDPQERVEHVLRAVTVRSITEKEKRIVVNEMQPSIECQIPYGKEIRINVSFAPIPFSFIMQKCTS